VKRTRSFGAIAVIVAALAFLMVKGLGSATEYFRTTDEAAAQANKLGSKRFRLEGVVVADSICAAAGGGVQFLVEENAKRIEVHHRGDPPELFRPDIPVVVSGRFDRTIASTTLSDAPVFASDLLMVKHSNIYVEKNKKRVADYVGKDGADAAAVPACA
jgi:cytochrome c-type biogenesis protein CcmE